MCHAIRNPDGILREIVESGEEKPAICLGDCQQSCESVVSKSVRTGRFSNAASRSQTGRPSHGGHHFLPRVNLAGPCRPVALSQFLHHPWSGKKVEFVKMRTELCPVFRGKKCSRLLNFQKAHGHNMPFRPTTRKWRTCPEKRIPSPSRNNLGLFVSLR